MSAFNRRSFDAVTLAGLQSEADCAALVGPRLASWLWLALADARARFGPVGMDVVCHDDARRRPLLMTRAHGALSWRHFDDGTNMNPTLD